MLSNPRAALFSLNTIQIYWNDCQVTPFEINLKQYIIRILEAKKILIILLYLQKANEKRKRIFCVHGYLPT